MFSTNKVYDHSSSQALCSQSSRTQASKGHGDSSWGGGQERHVTFLYCFQLSLKCFVLPFTNPEVTNLGSGHELMNLDHCALFSLTHYRAQPVRVPQEATKRSTQNRTAQFLRGASGFLFWSYQAVERPSLCGFCAAFTSRAKTRPLCHLATQVYAALSC